MLGYIVNTLIFALSFLGVLCLLVFIHEWGHYAVARLFKVKVERFSVGFGKPIFKKTAKSGTEWVIGRIPLGGYVKFMGDAGAASNPDTKQLAKIKSELDAKHGKDAWKSCFHFKPLYQRALVVLAGPMANFILAAVLFAGVALFFGTRSSNATVVSVVAGTPAAAAGFLPGDEFISINDKKVTSAQRAIEIIVLRTGENLEIAVQRGEEIKILEVVPKRVEGRDGIGGKFSGGQIGVQIGSVSKYKTYTTPEAIKYGGEAVYGTLASTTYYIGRLLRGKEDGKALGGIVKIGAITGKVGMDAANIEGGMGDKAKAMIHSLLSLAAILSVGLGFANLMPIPVLDGGHLLYYGYEAVMRRPLGEKAQEIGFRIGFTVLITLFLVLTWNDIGYVPSLFEKSG